MSPTLAGKRILVVEDEFLISLLAVDMLEELGAVGVGPAATVEEGLALLDGGPVDAAMLDVNLGGTRSDALADVLRARGIPFLIASGYGDAVGGAEPVLGKPYDLPRLQAALERLFA